MAETISRHSMTMEKHLAFIRANMNEMSSGQIEALLKGFINQNMFGTYDEIID